MGKEIIRVGVCSFLRQGMKFRSSVFLPFPGTVSIPLQANHGNCISSWWDVSFTDHTFFPKPTSHPLLPLNTSSSSSMTMCGVSFFYHFGPPLLPQVNNLLLQESTSCVHFSPLGFYHVLAFYHIASLINFHPFKSLTLIEYRFLLRL